MKIAWGIVMAGSLISGCTFVESCARVGRSVDWSIADAQKISDAQETSAKGEDAKPLELSAFENGVLDSYHPVRGERFRNTGREELRIIQVLANKNREGDGLRYVIAVDRRDIVNGMTFWVESPRDYADGELVAGGVYEFVGTHNYETLNKSHKTVRVFRELMDFKSK